MNESDITNLAGEYAEERASLMQGSLTTKLQAELVIRFLLRRYCLARKADVVRVLNRAHEIIEANRKNHLNTASYLGVGARNTICRLFPDVAKEVERGTYQADSDDELPFCHQTIAIMKVTRFCSEAEYRAFMGGDELRNTRDHYDGGKGGSVSVGFCFSPDTPRKAWRYLKGIVSCDMCMVLDIPRAELVKSKGLYVDYSAYVEIDDTIPMALKTEYCATGYSNKTAKLISAFSPSQLC